jgi:hypothetical protein
MGPGGCGKTKFKEPILNLVEGLLNQNSIPSTAPKRKRLRDIAIHALSKDVHRRAGSGLVVAGFGTKDYFPSMCSIEITARFRSELLALNRRGRTITADKPGVWETFAQDNPAKAGCRE